VRLVAANTLSTVEALSPAGEEVGKIVDFMIDTEQRTVVYGVLAVGGVLGVGAKMLAVPPASLSYDAGRQCLNLAVDTAVLDEATSIDRTNLPEHADRDLLAREQPRPSLNPTPRNRR
jgi:hypothetical protein